MESETVDANFLRSSEAVNIPRTPGRSCTNECTLRFTFLSDSKIELVDSKSMAQPCYIKLTSKVQTWCSKHVSDLLSIFVNIYQCRSQRRGSCAG